MRKLMVVALCAMAYGANAVAMEPVVVYSARKEELIKPIFDQFTKETGIPVKFLSDETPKLLARLQSEGAASPADLLITVDVSNLMIAKERGLFQPVKSVVLEKNVPAKYRDDQGEWFGLSKRVRAIFYNKEKVKPHELSTYEDLADPRWKGEILVRSSAHPYNQSLLANLIVADGEANTQSWAKGLVANFARTPQGGDSDQLRAVAAGEAKLAISNSYYYGKMSASALPEDKKTVEKVGIFFPNQNTKKGDGKLSGAHVNISGAGLLKHAKQPESAQKLLEYLSGEHAQNIYAESNKEFPVNPTVAVDPVLKAWGDFREDQVPLAVWGKQSQTATRIADVACWK